MFRRRKSIPRFAPFRLSVRLAMALAVIVIGPGTRPAGAVDFMYVSLSNNTIVRYDVSLATSALVQASGSVFVPAGQGLNNPYGLAFDTAGNLYAANFGNTITRYDSSGTRIGTDFVPTGQGLNNPVGLAFDTAGNLYAANFNGNTITRYDSSGTRIGTDFVPTGQGLSSPGGLAIDSSGNLYAANIGNATISKYNSAGVLQFSWSTTASPNFLAFPTVVPEPSTYVLGAIATGLMAVIARRRKANRKG